jgi:hypothetical protein
MQMLMQFHTGAIVGYNLYFTSGNYTFDDGLPYHNTSLLYILPLDKPVDVSGSIPLDELQVIPLPSLELDGGVSPETGGAAGTLFYNVTLTSPWCVRSLLTLLSYPRAA